MQLVRPKLAQSDSERKKIYWDVSDASEFNVRHQTRKTPASYVRDRVFVYSFPVGRGSTFASQKEEGFHPSAEERNGMWTSPTTYTS